MARTVQTSGWKIITEARKLCGNGPDVWLNLLALMSKCLSCFRTMSMIYCFSPIADLPRGADDVRSWWESGLRV
jgi:hypothetical protein